MSTEVGVFPFLPPPLPTNDRFFYDARTAALVLDLELLGRDHSPVLMGPLADVMPVLQRQSCETLLSYVM